MNRFRARGALSAVALLGILGGLPGLAGCSTGTPASSAADAAVRGSQSTGPGSAAMDNPNLDLGTSLGARSAPDFQLRNQFGQPMSLSQFRGKVVMLAFEDSQCTTVCPLTTQSMLQAKQLLGAAGSQVQLLGVDANPDATSVADVLVLLADPRPGQPVGLPDRFAGPAEGDLGLATTSPSRSSRGRSTTPPPCS